MKQEDWVKRMIENAIHLQWYGCPSDEKDVVIAETWVSRGDMVNAHYTLNYAVDLTLNLLYTVNREYIPPVKWKIFYSYTLPWKPGDYDKLLKNSLQIIDFTYEELQRRMKAIKRLSHEIIGKVEIETGKNRKDFGKYYVSQILKVRDFPPPQV